MSFNIPRKEVMTFKSGKFLFSCDFDFSEIYPLIIEFKTLYSSIQKLPVLPNIFSELETKLISRSIFGTAAIEGNPLTEEEVDDVIQKNNANENEDTVSIHFIDVKEQAKVEIRNLKALYNILKDDVAEVSDFKVSESFIKKTHSIVTQGLAYHHNSPGNYRNEPVEVGDVNHGGVYKPPKILADIQNLMKEFVLWINSEEMLSAPPSLRAAVAHYHLSMIHPFQDGNGRTSRFLESVILNNAGINLVPPMMSNYYHRNIDEYFLMFSESRKTKKMTPFLSFYYKGMLESLNEIHDNVVEVINGLLFKEFIIGYRNKKLITSRQHDFLLQLMETNKLFRLQDLFSDPIFKPLYSNVTEATARRDIKKLLQFKFILEKKDKKYQINWNFLKTM